MTKQLPNAKEEVRLARYLARRVCDGAAGRLEVECTHNPPRDTYFIGSLRPAPPSQTGGSRLPDELLSKIAPSAFGLEMRLMPTDANLALQVKLTWSVYYRVRPLRAQQIEHQGASTPAAKSARTQRRSRDDSGGLFPRYKKLRCSASGQILLERGNGASEWSIDANAFREAVSAEIARAQTSISEDPDRLRWTGTQQRGLPSGSLESDQLYGEFWNEMAEVPMPRWAWEFSASPRPSEHGPELILELEATNRSDIDRDDWRYEGFIFDVGLEVVAPNGPLRPFELDLVPRGFRYDRSMWGRGFNCGVSHVVSGESAVIRTTNVPRYEQPRLATSTEPPANFAALADNPVQVLGRISEAMHAFDQDWDQLEGEYRNAYADWDNRYGTEYAEDRQKFRDEMSRFDRGLEIIKSNDDVRLAFQLTNQAFAGNPSKPSWRLFQIVFLVSQVPGIAALLTAKNDDLRDREFVDIIYFPTGGGKTEAYLSVIVFHLFMDRLRGKTAGVSVWTRFPLRLLTLQQTQRAADVVGAAELIRSAHSDARLSGRNIDPFAIGYLAGQEATPNQISAPSPGKPPDPNWSVASDCEARQRWKKVVRCPSCRKPSVVVDFDPHFVRVLHRCTEPTCKFTDGILPVYVVDNELFRYLPSVVVGTIDKLASLGNQRRMAMLLGRVTGRCRLHGYCCQECCQSGCADPNSVVAGQPKGISGPTLFVQDELHLLKEGLGTFDAHYETFVQELLRDFGQTAPLKIVASSATIEAFERQSSHLYGRPARVFPGPGPRLSESFYAVTRNFPQRIYVGVLPHNKTIHNAMLELLECYQREVVRLGSLGEGAPNPYGGQVQPGSEDWRALLDPYRTSLCYFSATREMSSLRTDLDAHSTPILERDGVDAFRIEELSGSTSTDAVTRTLDKLERGDVPNKPAPNLVLATSMISHGVDVDRLNAMFFFGMPRQNAEYIQASSRVGRTHCGIVFTCMKPARERDQSHFSYFVKYHEFLGRLVEPVAINRWSKFSLQRTLPGLFMAVLLQDVANRQPKPGQYTRVDFVRRQISQGTLRFDDFIDILERAYLVKDKPDQLSRDIRLEIQKRVAQFRDQIVSGGAGAQWVSDTLMPSPMRSLREVDEQITIELDSNGSFWGDLVPSWGD